MKIISLLLATNLFAVPAALSAEILAGPIINPANGHTYYLLTNDTWTNSEAEANRLGGHLVTIDDALENDWVFETFGNFGDTPRGLWIGLTDQAVEGDFIWIDGSASAYRNWADGEPNDGNPDGEDIVHMWYPGHEFAGQWNDQGASATEAFGVLIHGVVEIPGPVLSVRVSQIALKWQSEIGIKYQVKFRSAVESQWQDLGAVIDGTGEQLSIPDPIEENQERRFYRVVIVP